MKFERIKKTSDTRQGECWTKAISPVSEERMLQELRHMHGTSACRAAILTDDDGSFLQVGGCGMCCCLEWHDMKRRRHSRAFQQPPVVPWPGITSIDIIDGVLFLRQEEYFRIQQVTEALVAFLHRRKLPDYIQWRDITAELQGKGCTLFTDTEDAYDPSGKRAS